MGSYFASELRCFSVQLDLSVSRNSFFPTNALMFLYAFIYFSLEDSNDVTLEAESAKLRTRDTRDDTSQESQSPELPVENIRSKERQSVETTEAKVLLFFNLVLLKILPLIIKSGL